MESADQRVGLCCTAKTKDKNIKYGLRLISDSRYLMCAGLHPAMECQFKEKRGWGFFGPTSLETPVYAPSLPPPPRFCRRGRKFLVRVLRAACRYGPASSVCLSADIIPRPDLFNCSASCLPVCVCLCLLTSSIS